MRPSSPNLRWWPVLTWRAPSVFLIQPLERMLVSSMTARVLSPVSIRPPDSNSSNGSGATFGHTWDISNTEALAASTISHWGLPHEMEMPTS